MTDEARHSGLLFLGRLAGGLVHEIKNPLSTLRINLTLLKEDLEAHHPEERGMRRRMEILDEEVRRLDAILNDFLRYAGMRRLDRQVHDLAAIVQDMVDFVGPGFRRDGIELTAQVPPMDVEIDAPLFKQALLNILLNAQQAMDGPGVVRVIGGEHWIEVIDSGRGISAADLERIFDVYYSGSKAGSGLGLPTARRILEEHGGHLDLESEEGVGTRVRLVLP